MVVQTRNFTDKDMLSLIRLLNETYKDSYEFTRARFEANLTLGRPNVSLEEKSMKL
jgi:hypothetical protein